MSNYVKMGSGAAPKPGTNNITNIPELNDPNLSQEEKDLRLALALQQQENASAYGAHKKRHDAQQSSQNNRVSRSSAGTRLASVRMNQKDEKDAAYGGSYAGPDDSSDARLASELHKVEVTTAKTASIIAQDSSDAKSAKLRSGRSVF